MSKDKQIPIEEVIKLIEKEDLMIDHLTNFEKSEATKDQKIGIKIVRVDSRLKKILLKLSFIEDTPHNREIIEEIKKEERSAATDLMGIIDEIKGTKFEDFLKEEIKRISEEES